MDDNLAQVIPWGFELARISVPVLLAAHIPAVEARLFDHESHVTVRENHIGEVHAWLADRL